MIYSIWFKLGLWFRDKIWQLAEWFLESLWTLLQVIIWLINKFFWLQILWEKRQKIAKYYEEVEGNERS